VARDEAGSLALHDKDGARGCKDRDVRGFNVQKESEGGACLALTVGTMASMTEERGPEEAVSDGVAETAAGYIGEGARFGFGILGRWGWRC
jgi:hypothetical protein